jgi:hypothetical protein
MFLSYEYVKSSRHIVRLDLAKILVYVVSLDVCVCVHVYYSSVIKVLNYLISVHNFVKNEKANKCFY